MYTVNEKTNNISIYGIDPSSGSLSAAGEVATTPMPHWIQFSPSGTYAYVVTDDGTTALLTMYTVDAASGNLHQTNSMPLTPGSFPTLKISPSGSYLALADGRNDLLTIYSLDASSGIPKLAAVTASPNIPWSIAFSTLGSFLFTVGNARGVTEFSLDGTTGKVAALLSLDSRVSVETFGKTPTVQLVVAHPKLPIVYLVDPTAQTVKTYNVNALNGSLNPLGATVSDGVRGSDAVIDPTGKFMYIGDWNRGVIAAFSLDAAGSLTPVSNSPIVTALLTQTQRGSGIALTIEPSGQYLYATSSETSQIVGFHIDQKSGILTPVSGTPLATGGGPFRVVAAP